ncbi:MAG TPA: transposase [Elusimicrobiales bacterium]|nr:transposase [Elusimicrobiales bacterium]
MPRKRYQPEQIVNILREAETGLTIADTCRKHGISDVTFHRWRRMYGGVRATEVQRLKQLESENRQLKQLAGDQALAIQVMKEEMKKRGWI